MSGYNYPPEFRRMKPLILARDGYRCVCCGRSDEELLVHPRCGTALIVHHEDGNKENNDKHNLATVCRSCQAKDHTGMHSRRQIYCRGVLRSHLAPIPLELVPVDAVSISFPYPPFYTALADEIRKISEVYARGLAFCDLEEGI